MTIKALELKIRRKELAEFVETFAAWELPILEAMHHTVEIVGETTWDREAPETQDEYKRLETRYGRTTNEDGSRGLPYVAAVFGQFNVGMQRLGDAIKAATVVTPTDVSDLMGATA